MNRILKLFFSMSLSGTFLILALFISKPLYKDRTGRRWQYYIWLVVIARLLLPFSPQESISGILVERIQQIVSQTIPAQTLENMIVQGDSSTKKEVNLMENEDSLVGPGAGSDEKDVVLTEKEVNLDKNKNDPSEKEVKLVESEKMPAGPKGDTVVQYSIKVFSHLWMIWIGVAALLFMRKVTIYQSFVNYIKAGGEEISDIRLLDLLAQVGGRIGVKRPVELYVNKLVSSPLLLGFFHPCVVLPSTKISDTDFWYTAWHELSHFKRLDLFYKWLVQLTVCIHWFNPFVWRMGRELGHACELACDEAVIRRLDENGRRAYGDTLLHALESGGDCKSSLSAVMLSESAEQLKERLCVIMNFKKKSGLTVLVSTFLTVVVMVGATTAGAAVPSGLNVSKSDSSSASVKEQTNYLTTVSGKNSGSMKQAEEYYKAGNLPAFGKAFSELEKNVQKTWLKKIYKEQEIAFFSVCFEQLDKGSALVGSFAKTAYQDGELSFFSVLTDYMDRKTLKSWLNRAKKDKRTKFQVALYDALDMDEELEAMEEKQEKKRIEEYKKHGISVKGKSYYYKGKLVKIFLDIRKDSSFYTLDINPKGIVNVKVTRDANGKIKKVGRMSAAQAKELLEDWDI